MGIDRLLRALVLGVLVATLATGPARADDNAPPKAPPKTAPQLPAAPPKTAPQHPAAAAPPDTVVETDLAPPESVPKSEETIDLKFKDGSSYKLGPDALGGEVLENYRGMDPGEKERFLKNRALILAAASSMLHAIRTPIGIARKTGVRASQAKEAALWCVDATVDAVIGLAGFGPRSCFRLSGGKTDEDREAERALLAKTLREAGTEGVGLMLKRLDGELWAHAPFFAKINETGVSVEAGVAGGAKVGPWGVFFITGTGVSFAIDPKEKAFVIEIFQDVEWTRRALPGYVGAEAFGSLFLSATHHDWDKGLVPEAGTALSLPGVAGCITRNNARIGIAKGIGVGFPGAAALESSIVRIPLLRVGISPSWTGFVRGKFLGSQFITGPLQWCGQQIANACSAVYSFLAGGK